jgi:hypothetical protein
VKQKIEIEVDIPEGYRFVRWGLPKKGESFCSGGRLRAAAWDWTDTEQVIIEKDAPKYRAVTEADVGKVIQVRDTRDDDCWHQREFAGFWHGRVATSEGFGVFYTWDEARVPVGGDKFPGWRLATAEDLPCDCRVADSEAAHPEACMSALVRSLTSFTGLYMTGRDSLWRYAYVRV